MKSLKHLKLLLILLAVSFTLNNCEKEDDTNHSKDLTQVKELDYAMETINYGRLLSDPEIQESLNVIARNFINNKQQELNYRTSTEVADGLTILTDYINRIEAGETITWTFEVETPALESSDLENFMVKKYNNEFTYFLISYEKDLVNEENLFEKVTSYRISEEYLTLDDLDLVSRTPLDWVPEDDGGGDNECEGELIWDNSPCVPGGGTSAHGPVCQHLDYSTGGQLHPGGCNYMCNGTPRLVIDLSGCFNEVPDGPTGDPVGGDAPNDSQIGSGENPEGSEDPTLSGAIGITDEEDPCIPEEPNPYDVTEDCSLNDLEFVIQIIGNCINSESPLPSRDINWLFNNPQVADQIKNFIEEHGCNGDIADSVIDILTADNGVNTFPEALEVYLIAHPNQFIDFLLIEEPDNPITNIAEFLECFDTTQDATLTVYIDEPVPGSGDTYDMTWSGAVVGHAFLSLSQGSNTSVYGYYPAGDDYTNSPAALGEDGGEQFSTSISTTISGSELNDIINYSINFNATYDLETSNCTDFIIDIGNLGGLNLPNAEGTWPGGGGSNPGTMGQFINTLTPPSGVSINTTGGNAPTTNKGC